MSDDTLLNPGFGGDTVATDDIGGVKYQRIKVIIGADGINGGDVSSANPLPVSFVAQVIQSVRLHITGPLTDVAVVTPASGKKVTVVLSSMATANVNTLDFSFRTGCGVATTPTTTGVLHAHPGLANDNRDESGDGSAAIGAPGAVDAPLRITCSDPGGSADYLASWYES